MCDTWHLLIFFLAMSFSQNWHWKRPILTSCCVCMYVNLHCHHLHLCLPTSYVSNLTFLSRIETNKQYHIKESRWSLGRSDGKKKASIDVWKWNKAKNRTQFLSVGQNWALSFLVELGGAQGPGNQEIIMIRVFLIYLNRIYFLKLDNYNAINSPRCPPFLLKSSNIKGSFQLRRKQEWTVVFFWCWGIKPIIAPHSR